MAWWQSRKRSADLDRELRSDLELEEEEQRAGGLPPDEARYAARRAFGNTTLIREQTRATWGASWGWSLLERCGRDFRLALRQLAGTPGFTTTAVLTLALGIGASTAIFSLLNAVLLRPLPFPHQDRLVWLSQQDHSLPGVMPESLSYPDYFDWRTQSHSFSGIASYVGGGVTLEWQGESQRLDAQTVSSNFFQVLGSAPMLGRDFRPEDEQAGNRAAMLSYSLWQSAFGSAKDIVGRTIRLDDHATTVAGVMPKGFQFPLDGPASALWISIADDAAGKKTGQRGFDVLSAIGRLKPDVTVAQAKTDLSVVAARLARQYPDTNKELYSALVENELEHMTGDTRPALRVLFGAVTLLLLMVCANVAGLLLVRGSRRAAEFALRTALGASRAALIRQLLIESVTLSLCGGAAGIVAAWGLMRAFIPLLPVNIPRIQDASVNGSMLLFAVLVSLLTGLVFGMLPAWRLSQATPSAGLREGSRTVGGGRRGNRVHNGLVVAQTAIGLVLLISSGLLMRSFVRILNVDPGFDARQVLTARIGVPFARYSHDQHVQFFQQLIERMAAAPGVESVSAGWPLPLSNTFATISFNIQGKPIARGDEPSEALGVAVPGYFQTMRIPLLAGRTFGEQDGVQGQPSIIVNQAFADKYFPGQNPLGQHIQVRLGDDVFNSPIREVVGVVGNIKLQGLTVATPPEYFLPYAQAVITNPWIVIRTAGDPATLENTLRAAIHAIDSSVPVYQVEPLADYVSKSAAEPRFQTLMLTGFATIALLLAAIGLYSLLSNWVTQRTTEIGVRMALGAQRSDVMGMIVGRGMAFALVGIGIGVAASIAVTRLLSEMLYGIRPSDPVTFVVTTGVLFLVSLAAASVPAWRAANLDPNRTLREQ